MTVIKRVAQVPYTPAQMYQLVSTVEDYPSFLSWCESSTIHSCVDDEVHATLCLSKGGFRKSFTTCNRMQKDQRIDVKLISGPFKQLEGIWRFEPLPNHQCRVSLDLEFEFINRFLSLALGPLFTQVANTLVDNFVKHAQTVYGSPDV